MEEVPRYRIWQKTPKNSQIWTRQEILQHQENIIHNWKPWTDVWALKFGTSILAGAAAATGVYVNHKFRVALKLRQYGFISTLLGLVATPTVTVYILQTELVLRKLLTYQVSCPACLESKSALMQSCAGLFVPLLGAPFANFSVAADSGIYNVPHRNDYRGMTRIVWSVYRPLVPRLATIFTLHALLAGFITYSQVKSFIYIQQMQHLKEQDEKQKLQIEDNL